MSYIKPPRVVSSEGKDLEEENLIHDKKTSWILRETFWIKEKSDSLTTDSEKKGEK